MIKTPAQAAANYGTNGGSATAANLWGTNLSSALDTALTKAAAAVASGLAGLDRSGADQLRERTQ